MRLLNMLLFTIAAILLFRTTRSAFGPLPAFLGLATMMFLPTLFYWSISLLKEPLYLLGTTLVVTGAISASEAATRRERAAPWLAAITGLAVISGLRPGAFMLTILGLGCGLAGLIYFASSVRFRIAAAVVAVLLFVTAASQPAAQQRLTAALESTAKTHAGHVFTVGHAYKLLDEGFYFNPSTAAASTLTLTAAEAAR